MSIESEYILIDRLKIWVSSKSWFWKLRTWLGKIGFVFERSVYQRSASAAKVKVSARIFGSFTWIGVKSLFWVIIGLTTLISFEGYIRSNWSWLPQHGEDDNKFNIEQLRLYAQLLTAIFSIYFATIGIILSAGYTRLRRDIIQMLTNEQVGSVYSRVLVLAAMFCLAATSLPLFGYEPGLFVYAFGTILTLLSALALFPLGQRLFNFFDLNLLVKMEILPSIARHIKNAANPRNSISLANHHSKVARLALGQLSYIDDRVKADKERLEDNLPELSNYYTALLLHYFQQKHNIDQESYWFPRRSKHKQWFLAGDTATSMALQTSSQQMLIEETPDHQWLENEVLDRLASHVKLAFQVGDFDLALKLIGRFSSRITTYSQWFQFEVGMQEVKNFKEIIEQAFASFDPVQDDRKATVKVGIADTWAALGSNLCLETLRRMMTFEKELKQFFEADEWNEKTLRSLPAFIQTELAFIVDRISFEEEVEGRRLSKPKYIQQLAVKKLLHRYSTILPTIRDFYNNTVPDFVSFLSELKMSEAATQVVLASLHNHWKLPGWFNEITQLLERYRGYEHYSGEHFELPDINTIEMSQQLTNARGDAIARLGKVDMVKHIFEQKHNDDLPDHFGQIYFELAEACIGALEQNDEVMLNKLLPMFLSLAFLASDSKFADQSLNINAEFRLHLISTVINDLASVLGFAILYASYFDNEKLSEIALSEFDDWMGRVTEKQRYLKKMVLLSNPHSFSMSASPREMIRMNWKLSFEKRARHDGFADQIVMTQGQPHLNKIVRVFLRSHCDASHLFFAKQVVPQIESTDFEIDHQITDLARFLREEDEGTQHEGF